MNLPYPFQLTDAGRAESRRPRQDKDCTVMAYAHLMQLSYDEAFDILKAAGRKNSQGFHIGPWLDSQTPLFWKFSFPGEKGYTRMNPVRFCELYPVGRFICRTAGHVFAVIDGVVHDSCPQRPDRCIYVAWTLEHFATVANNNLPEG